jgi:hypothetical protein
LAGVTFNFINLTNTLYKDWRERRRAREALRQSQPQPERGRSSRVSLIISFFVSIASISLSIKFLTDVLLNIDPITRETIFSVILYAGSILFQLVIMSLSYIMYQIGMIYNLFSNIIIGQQRHMGLINKILRILDTRLDTRKKDINEVG